jgi:hypothetical protein
MNVCNTSKTSNLEKDVKEQFLYMRPISRRAVFRGLSGTALGALVVGGMRIPIDAAAGFADPAFEAQWRAGEAIAPNFWGPLSTATGAVQEAYREVAGGQRLVQYFDKGRMELTDGGVTNGLLAREIITGMIQTGNESYEHRPAPAIPIAGDTDNPGRNPTPRSTEKRPACSSPRPLESVCASRRPSRRMARLRWAIP